MTTTTNNVIAEIDAAAIVEASQSSDHMIIRTNGGPGSNRFALSFTSPEEYCRRVCQGPILSGPYLCGFGIGTTIHNGPITANPVNLFVRTGDVIRIYNLVERGTFRTFDFVANVCPRGYVTFECVEAKFNGRQKMNVDAHEINKEEYSAILKAEFDAKRA